MASKIRAEAAGTVKRVLVSSGQNVLAKDLLIEFGD